MKKVSTLILLTTSLLFMWAGISFAQTADLTINITGLELPKGKVQIGLYNTSNSFPKEDLELCSFRLVADSTFVSHTITDLPWGDYAVAFYHDMNDDGECNKNWVGIPLEPYGFSNNVRVRFSAPSFEKTKFTLVDDHEILISLNK